MFNMPLRNHPETKQIHYRHSKLEGIQIGQFGQFPPEGGFALNFGGDERNSTQLQRFGNLSQQRTTLLAIWSMRYMLMENNTLQLELRFQTNKHYKHVGFCRYVVLADFGKMEGNTHGFCCALHISHKPIDQEPQRLQWTRSFKFASQIAPCVEEVLGRWVPVAV